MRCPHCGEQIPDNSNFCPYCSKKLIPSQKPSPIMPMLVIAASTIVIFICVLFFIKTGVIGQSIVSNQNTDPHSTPALIDSSSQSSTKTNVSPDNQNSQNGSANTSTGTVQADSKAALQPEETATPTPIPTATPTLIPTEAPLPTATPIPATNYVTIYGGYQAPASDFIFPESSDEYLSYERMNEMLEAPDKDTMNRRSQLAINELLARYGFPFTNKERQTAQDARDQFNNKGWYQQVNAICPSTNYQVIVDNYMNSYERANFEALNNWQKDHGVWY